MSKYAVITAQPASWPVRELRRVLGVSRSGYYQWQRAEACPAPSWQTAAQHVFTCHARRYGTHRLRAEPQAEGHPVGHYALRTWLRASGQRALSTRPQRPRITQADPDVVVAAENLLLGQPTPARPNQVWGRYYLPAAAGRALVLRGHVAA